MIKSINSICNVGRFSNYSAVTPIQFGRLTIVCAENGQGKTTLAAILRSLRANTSSYIMGRKSLGKSGDVSVTIQLANGTANFQGGQWSLCLPELEIFDTDFVERNVCSGHFVSPDHKRNLLNFILEEKGVELWKAFNKNDELQASKTKEVQNAKTEIVRLISSGISLEQLGCFQKDDGIEEKIKAKEQEISAATRFAELQKGPYLYPLNIYSLPISLYEFVFTKTLGSLVVEAQKAVHNHISTCMDGLGEQWIAAGMPFLKNNLCPFCGQEVKDSKLIESYRQYFDDIYVHFKEFLNNWCKELTKHFEVNQVKASLAQAEVNAAHIGTWRPYLNLSLPDVDQDSLLKLALKITDKLNHSVRAKTLAPLEKVSIPDDARQDIQQFNAEMGQLETYNQAVSTANRVIQDYKTKLTAADAKKLGQELKLLQDQKTRHKEAVDFCEAYSKRLQEKSELETDKATLKKALDAHSDNIIPAYQNGINEHLISFGAGFKLCNVEQNYVGKKPTSNYCIEINSTRVELGNDESPESVPNYGNTLSAGDKSTLAFAFFLARLDRDSGLENKIVVFDDPISSLDSNRKTFTRSNILRVAAKAKQVVVLTHDPMYAWDLFKQAPKKGLSPVAIKIVRVGEDSSGIEGWDIQWETSSDHFKEYSGIQNYLDQGASSQDALRAAANLVRPLVEGSMRHRFPRSFDSEMTLGIMIKKINGAANSDAIVILKPLISKLEQINTYGSPVHHSGRGGDGMQVIDDNELRAHCRLAMELAHGFVENNSPNKN